MRLEETCCHSNSSEKPSANTDVKNSKGVNNNNNQVELTAGGKTLAERKIQRVIFQGDALSLLLLFVIAMMPLSNILRKYKLQKKRRKD